MPGHKGVSLLNNRSDSVVPQSWQLSLQHHLVGQYLHSSHTLHHLRRAQQGVALSLDVFDIEKHRLFGKDESVLSTFQQAIDWIAGEQILGFYLCHDQEHPERVEHCPMYRQVCCKMRMGGRDQHSKPRGAILRV